MSTPSIALLSPHRSVGLMLRSAINASGGAINVPWTPPNIISCSISHTQFTGNAALIDGGAIVLSAAETVFITNSQFVSNRAGNTGGAVSVYIDPPPSALKPQTQVYNLLFDGNIASRGGAVSCTNFRIDVYNGGCFNITSEDVPIIFMNNRAIPLPPPTTNQSNANAGGNPFTAAANEIFAGPLAACINFAPGGGAMTWIRALPLNVYARNLLLINNSAPFGSNFSTDPYALNITGVPSTTAPGIPLQTVITVSVNDYLGQFISSLNEFQILMTANPLNCTKQIVAAVVNGSATFDNVRLLGSWGTLCTLTFNALNPEESLPMNQSFTIKFDYCPPGYGYINDRECDACPGSTYAIHNRSDEACHQCPDNAICSGQYPPFPKTGYWIWPLNYPSHWEEYLSEFAANLQVYACPPDVCTGVQDINTRINTLDFYNACGPHRNPNSPFCGECDEGYSEWVNTCVSTSMNHPLFHPFFDVQHTHYCVCTGNCL